MSHDIGRLHHVGHVVSDMGEALTLYRRLGFTVEPPAYPTLARRAGAAPEPFGAANTHADFPHSFVELVTCVQEGGDTRVPGEAKLVPLQAPAELLPQLVERISDTSANVAAWLDRFEGLHILMFSSPDIDAAAARLSEARVVHGGVNTVHRPVETIAGTLMESIRYLEVDGCAPGARPGTVSEGRVGVVSDLAPHVQGSRQTGHLNGAFELVEVMACVAEADLDTTAARYQDYLDRPARPDGPSRFFDLDGARLTLVPESHLATVLPGDHAPALPAFVAYAVAVHDLSATRKLLQDNGVPHHRTGSGDLFVPATSALGAAVIFRAATGTQDQRPQPARAFRR
ncbi:VOC family protein [Streptomyces sp. NPDC057743]|uniref:VOC family protein n=1 Tax=Streptomyces sp. NPDC057743 TaxID=3346236 RepID=UPI00369D028B